MTTAAAFELGYLVTSELEKHRVAGLRGKTCTAEKGTAQWAAYHFGRAGLGITTDRILTAIATGTGRHRKPPSPLSRLWTAVTSYLNRTRPTTQETNP